ncbi:hypothetical protein [Sphingobium sp. EM0848]|uniref:hypothetical protein n=1 Tax=Sphingobium sp. EM0848 TaxID=2743473 RepID=UPI00159C6A78|nr:hypothetical protein [Sphingobium sp. EM0848]
MNKTRWMTGSLMALALLTGSAASAQMQPQRNYPQDQGDLADEAQPPADEPSQPEDQANRAHADDDFSDVVGPEQGRADTNPGYGRYGRRDAPNNSAIAPESETAIDNCALAARDEAERDGGYAEVRQVQQPRETRNGYDVEGDVEVRSGWRAQDGATRHFTCSVQNGRVADVYFQQGRAAR